MLYKIQAPDTILSIFFLFLSIWSLLLLVGQLGRIEKVGWGGMGASDDIFGCLKGVDVGVY